MTNKIITSNKELNALLAGNKQVAEKAAAPKYLMARMAIVRTKDPHNGEPWPICTPQQIPEWVKHPDILAALEAGMMVHDPEKSPWWYRAVNVEGLAH